MSEDPETYTPVTPTIRCRCPGCQGPPLCMCCNEPVFEIPDQTADMLAYVERQIQHEDPRAERDEASQECQELRESLSRAQREVARLEHERDAATERLYFSEAGEAMMIDKLQGAEQERDAVMAECRALVEAGSVLAAILARTRYYVYPDLIDGHAAEPSGHKVAKALVAWHALAPDGADVASD